MDKLIKYILYLCLGTIIIGPLAKISIISSEINLYLTDLLVGILFIFWVVNYRKALILLKQNKFIYYFLLFILFAFISLIFSPIPLTFFEKIVSSLYLIRFFSYVSIYITLKHLILTGKTNQKYILNLLVVVGIILSILGWIQYFLYPDLRNLSYLGWDPHYRRIFASYFDPNYLGLILNLSLIILINSKPKSFMIIFYLLIILITIAFTYSRSTYLSLLIGTLYLSYATKKYYIVALFFSIVIMFFIILPKGTGEGVNLVRVFSIEQRIDNWKEGIQIFTRHPLLGIGFNTSRYAKRYYSIGGQDLSSSHSGAGFDNSLVFVGVTTGIIGLAIFIIMLIHYFQSLNLLGRISIIMIITHSLFLNSLFFPWVALWWWTVKAIDTFDGALFD